MTIGVRRRVALFALLGTLGVIQVAAPARADVMVVACTSLSETDTYYVDLTNNNISTMADAPSTGEPVTYPAVITENLITWKYFGQTNSIDRYSGVLYRGGSIFSCKVITQAIIVPNPPEAAPAHQSK